MYVLVVILAIIMMSLIVHILFGDKSNLPPGKTGWPLIGENLEYIKRPDRFVKDRMQSRSADVFQTSLMGEKMVIFCGASANKFIFANERKLVGHWIPSSLDKTLGIKQDSETMEFIHTWLRLKSTMKYVPIMDSKVQKYLESHWTPFDEIKAYELSQEFTFSIACGLFLDCHKPEHIKELAKPFFTLVSGLMSAPINIPGTSFYRAMKALKIVRQKLVEIIKHREMELTSTLSKNMESSQQNDILGQVLMGLREKGHTDIKEEEIANEMVGLIFAGFHTTSITLAFLIGHLAEYPDIYDKVLKEQLEISQLKKEGELLNWTDIQKMKYSWNVVCESMRLKAPALGGFREAITDFTYKGFTIPKGWKISLTQIDLKEIRWHPTHLFPLAEDLEFVVEESMLV